MAFNETVVKQKTSITQKAKIEDSMSWEAVGENPTMFA